MTEPDPPAGALGLADFISDLRAELGEAARRSAGKSLRLTVSEVEVTVDVGVTLTTTGEASAKASAKFWVFASAEGAVRGERSSERLSTQQLTLKLTPQVVEVVRDSEGRETTRTRQLDVGGDFATDEDRPAL